VCGIAGQARSDGAVPSQELLARMCAAQEHRGPDSRGVHLAAGVALGIQRLRVIDLDTGDQPIFNEDKSVAVVLNGEIYNYRELRRELRARGHRFVTQGDTEVIAHLYEEYGSEFASHLHGMFAAAVWDAKRRRLTLSRDRLGKKPLFYAARGGVLTFASELRSLLQDETIPREIDTRALDMYLALRYVPAPLSAFAAVAKLPPAHRLVFADGRVDIERYWRPEYETKREVADARELREELREHLRRAVRSRMVADVPVGALLSGGVDSAAVVAAMAQESSGPVRTFSVGFEDEAADERPAARMVAERFATEHHEFVVRPDAVELLPRIVRHHGEPFADATAIPMFQLCEVTRGHVTVALTGDGGDEVFGGYTRYASNLALARLSQAPRAVRSAIAAAAAMAGGGGSVDGWASRIGRAARTLAMDEPSRYFEYVSHLSGLRRERIYTDEFRESVDLAAPGQLIAEAWQTGGATESLDRMLATDQRTYLPDDLLCKADIASMASSLELRSPLLDHELVQFAATLPMRLKVKGASKKVILREALTGTVPQEILNAPKRGFHPPMARWLRGPLGAHARELLLDDTARRRGHFRPEAVAALLGEHASGAADRSEMIWRLMVYEQWHREFVDATPAAAVSATFAPMSIGS
jgi:asparagine synthase (glutamine-hydrolysing)